MPFWVWAVSEKGKLAVFRPSYATEEEASSYGFSHLGSNFEVTQLTTIDMAEATRAIKRIVFDRTLNLDRALQRAKHQLPNENKEVT